MGAICEKMACGGVAVPPRRNGRPLWGGTQVPPLAARHRIRSGDRRGTLADADSSRVTIFMGVPAKPG